MTQSHGAEPMEDGLNAYRDLSHAVGGVRELKGYAVSATAAERDLGRALMFLNRASTSAETREDRGHYLGWAVVMAEAAVKALRNADPAYTKFHQTDGPMRAFNTSTASPSSPNVTDPGKTTEGLNQ